jgi:hypothetical protein
MRLNSSAPCRIEHGAIDTGACKELWAALLDAA